MQITNRFVALTLVALTLVALAVAALPMRAAAKPHDSIQFDLVPANSALVPCLMGADGKTPTARVTVRRGLRNDHLELLLKNVKPGLRFDLFTIEHSPLLSDCVTPDPAFAGVGLAWYQSEVKASRHPTTVTIDTILLDQIFGIDTTDPGVNLPPTQTFHIGVWFDDPADAAACGFTGTTPFNGEHNAGPLAFVSVPNSGVGPLDTSVTPATCGIPAATPTPVATPTSTETPTPTGTPL